jgi:cobalt-zinc-cadmium efflux system membrane fusion protein
MVCAVALGGAAYKLWTKPKAVATLSNGADQADDPNSKSLVHLSAGKLDAAELHISTIAERDLQATCRVPGKIGYNTARRVELKVPASGTVQQVLAQPGQHVKRGDPLARLSSVEVGLARDEVVKSEADSQLAKKEQEWAEQIAKNVIELLKVLDEHPEVPVVEQTFVNKLLGDHRDRVITAYSKFQFAERTARDTQVLAMKGSISDRTVQERTSGREVAAAGFKTACEQSRFDSSQQRLRAQAALEHAERIVAVNRQKLRLLLGPFTEIATLASDNTSCELILRSPMDGVIEDRFVSDAAQFISSQALFSLANTDTLWVSAQLYEREWAAVSRSKFKEVRVQSPALPGYEVTATVQFVGITLSPETRAVPLVAEFVNTERQLKPGMFAWVTVPLKPPRHVLCIPAGAVMRHEQEIFVFIQEHPDTFRKVEITLGTTTPEFVEVTHGLKVGQQVVDQGAFFLKSELLLEGEEP